MSIEFVQFSFFQHLIIFFLLLTVIAFVCNAKVLQLLFPLAFLNGLIFFFFCLKILIACPECVWPKSVSFPWTHGQVFLHLLFIFICGACDTLEKSCVLGSNQHSQHPKKKKNEPKIWKKSWRMTEDSRIKRERNQVKKSAEKKRKDGLKKKLIGIACERNIKTVVEEHVSSENKMYILLDDLIWSSCLYKQQHLLNKTSS